MNLLNAEAKRKRIAEALTEAAGMECTFEACLPGKANSEPAGDEGFLAQLRESFGAENVSVQQELK